MGGMPGTPLCTANPDSCNNCGQCVVNKPGAVTNLLDTGATRLGSSSGIKRGVDQKVASMIDHTLLKPDATKEELTILCKEAMEYGFATCCVNSSNIPFCARLLRGSSVKPIAVVGFPLGAASTQSKVFESREAIRNGAEEIDMVINIGAIKDRDYQLVYEDILKVVEASKPKKVKVIIETSSLTDEEKVIACALSKAANAAFVKTSTGFAGGGATVHDIELMRKVVGNDMEVKASGGVRTKEDADAMIKAGANRIGASASVSIVTGKNPGKGKY
ncbi:deoxyribose-phosphate aldolase [bacterium]|nr:deoxyribose-phosphate aldolase [bacterium]MBU1918939.1 deoxyribose-phosphate aldolase [bacterium]